MSGKTYRVLTLSIKTLYFSGFHWPLARSSSLVFCTDCLNIGPVYSRSESNHLLQMFSRSDPIPMGYSFDWLCTTGCVFCPQSVFTSYACLLYPARWLVFQEPEQCLLFSLYVLLYNACHSALLCRYNMLNTYIFKIKRVVPLGKLILFYFHIPNAKYCVFQWAHFTHLSNIKS